jgi:phosphopantetheinyl transferase (holo-ACP synthase)
LADSSILGVGLDMEERAAFRRLDDASVERAARRWLTDKEREWCATQDSFADALLVVLSCKEAVFKAFRQGRAAHQVRLAVEGCCARGQGWAEQSAVPIRVVWHRWRRQVVALAVATTGDTRRVLDWANQFPPSPPQASATAVLGNDNAPPVGK